MTVLIHVSRYAGAWEQLFLRSVAAESSVAVKAAERSFIEVNDAEATLELDAAGIRIRGAIEWDGDWDVSPRLLTATTRAGAWIVLMAAEDLDDRSEALVVETRHAAALRGRTLRMVAIGELRRTSRAVDYVLPQLSADELLRLTAASRAVLRVEGSGPQLPRIAARAGRGCFGIGPGGGGDHCIASYSSIDLADALDQPVRTAPLASPFAPDLLKIIRERAEA